MTDPLVAKMGVSRSLLGGIETWGWPLHGLRHPPEGDTSGWYCWTGEWSDDDDFFVPLHASHLIAAWSDLEQYLLRPPGSRFVLSPDYVDLWHDEALLDI